MFPFSDAVAQNLLARQSWTMDSAVNWRSVQLADGVDMPGHVPVEDEL